MKGPFVLLGFHLYQNMSCQWQLFLGPWAVQQRRERPPHEWLGYGGQARGEEGAGGPLCRLTWSPHRIGGAPWVTRKVGPGETALTRPDRLSVNMAAVSGGVRASGLALQSPGHPAGRAPPRDPAPPLFGTTLAPQGSLMAFRGVREEAMPGCQPESPEAQNLHGRFLSLETFSCF